MRKIFKKIISVTLAVVLLLTAAPLSGLVGLDLSGLFELSAEAAAYSGTCGDNLTWSLDTSTGVLNITGTGAMKNWTSYSSVPWYSYRDYIKSVNIGDSVTTIGEGAFYSCDSLTSVTIGDSVTTIGGYAFCRCESFTSVTIPDSVTTIGDYAFCYCDSLTSITVDSDNKYYSSDSYGALFNKNKTELIQYPIGNTRTSYTIPDSVTTIGDDAFAYCRSLTSVTIPDSVTTIGDRAFGCCDSLTSVTIPDSVTTIGDYAFCYCTALEYVHIPASVTEIGEDILYDTSVCICSATEDCYAKTYADAYDIEFRVCTGHNTEEPIPEDIYNLGEETYSFDNFGDSDSQGGHCFGMSMTSSAYHMGELDITDIGGSGANDLYTLNLTNKVKAPICKYQAIQGKYSVNATVAGGCYYKYDYYDVVSDWNAVVNYVKNHNYDNKGTLQIGFRKEGEGGHAINFLRYEEVDGQPRIYAYDNNFPDRETYFYQDSNGNIRQAPSQTFSGTIDCIALRDVSKYFSSVDSFDLTRYIYADRDAISISGAEVYPIDGNSTSGERVVFEIPADAERVVITPLTENATFTYIDEEYSFDSCDEAALLSFEDAGEDYSIEFSQTVNIDLKINKPSTTTVKYGDTLVLQLEEIELPEGYTVEWSVEGTGFNKAVGEDGKECRLTSTANGTATVTAKIVDEDGEAVFNAEGSEISASITLTSNASFWNKIVSFFKNLFGVDRYVY